MDNPQLLALFGYNDESELKAEDGMVLRHLWKRCADVVCALVTYYFYMQLGYSGLVALSNFNIDSKVSSSFTKT